MNYRELAINKIQSFEHVKKQSLEWKNKGYKIVFTNGCFDILHTGHINYLQEAANQGNKLIIGLNSDQSVKLLKGDNRPLNTVNDRAYILANLPFVDAIVIFEDQTPQAIIANLLPDVLVKGGDYTVDQIAGAAEVIANGGKVHIAAFSKGYSTTEIINKIKH